MRPKLTFANVISCLALFIALGGLAVAAGLPKNSVGTKQLKKNAVTAAKIKAGAVSATKIQDRSLTGAKIADGSLTGTQINASSLGTVPTAERASRAGSAGRADVATRAERADVASRADVANLADSLPPSEPWHIVGAVGEPALMNGWEDFSPESVMDPIAFYKDHEGVVHLKGRALGGTATHMFNLPPGFRPPEKKTIFPVVACSCPSDAFGVLNISGTTPTEPGNSGSVYVPINATVIALDGVTFRAES
ncbi:MAG TPA: hypothetical protein VGO36_08090 [Solirubrobacterales bacterium]|jgi:hypothetical protein|nr:hypothetical protein [Solirubrobacterales bacterium]